jgi:hypothetical protein
MKTTIKTYNTQFILLLVFMIGQVSLFAQSNLKSDVMDFMGNYEKFSSFTEDGLSYNNMYEMKFRDLFERNGKNYQVFNDVDSVHIPCYLSKERYVSLVRKNFPKGVNVNIVVKKISKPRKSKGNSQLV